MSDTEKATAEAVQRYPEDFRPIGGSAMERRAFIEGARWARLAALEEAADRIHEVHVNGHAKDALNSREPYASYCRARSEAASSVEADIRDILRSSSPEGSGQ